MAQAARKSNLPTGMSPAQVFAALVSSSDDAIVTETLGGVIASWNQGAVRLYGYTPDEAVGQPMTMLSPPDRQGEIADILAKVSAGEHVSHYETIRRRKDGSTFPISVSVSPISDEFGTTVGVAFIARDITEQRQFRTAAAQAHRTDDLVRANQNLTGFAYSVSHDLRTRCGRSAVSVAPAGTVRRRARRAGPELRRADRRRRAHVGDHRCPAAAVQPGLH
ncbi:MAG: PAS domain-containing protein [Streptosporangiaceae bacterium]